MPFRDAPPKSPSPRASAGATLLAALLTAVPGVPLHAGVILNEVMYHPPNDRDELQWIELLNPDPQAADLSGWSFGKGLDFTFPKGTTLAPGAFLVVSRDRVAFEAAYGRNLPVLGDFNGRLSHGGETIELDDAQGHPMDRLQYGDSDRWPQSPDGMSASLERLCVSAVGEPVENWAPSPLPETRKPAGTPGRPNANAHSNPPPAISAVDFANPTPGQPLRVSARIMDPDGIRDARLAYQVLSVSNTQGGGRTRPAAEVEIPMTPEGDRYRAEIPGQPEGCLLRFRIRATDKTGSERILPHPHDARPTWSAFVGGNTNQAQVPFAFLMQFGAPEQPGANLGNSWNPGPRRARAAAGPREPSRGNATMIYQPSEGSAPQVFDYIRVTPRQGGFKVRFQSHQPLAEMSTVNLLFEFQPRYLLSEYLAYELFRAAGIPAPLSGHWRLWLDGRPMGYHLFVEQPNGSFLRRNHRDSRGDLYKLLWYGRDVVGQHEKKNNPESGHAPIVSAIQSLQQSSGAAQWKIIEEQFQVDSFINYYAVNMCIQNWDGFFNNYFVYRSPGPTGKWEIIPWDEDKTWGDYDGASPRFDWYGMPLTFGMNGDQPPRGLPGEGGGIHGGPAWWRHPGWFSGPLLANPEFRSRFLHRLREITDTVFTPEAMEPIIAAVEKKLAPEVRYRAEVVARNQPAMGNGWTSPSEFPSGDAKTALSQFQRHIESFRNQARFRRQAIQRELDKAGVK